MRASPGPNRQPPTALACEEENSRENTESGNQQRDPQQHGVDTVKRGHIPRGITCARVSTNPLEEARPGDDVEKCTNKKNDCGKQVHDVSSLRRRPAHAFVRDNGTMLEFTMRGGLDTYVEAEIDVKRSRFICRLVRVDSEPAAREVIETARKTHWDARHHCSAFVLGSSTEADQVRRSNDDGEPSGTAGRPILDILNGRNLIDCVAVVSRYFGGTLLGTGGLIRAYSDAAAAAVDIASVSSGLALRQRRELFRLPLSHTDAGRVEAELRQHGVVVLGTEYGSSAVMTLAAPPNSEPALAALVAGATAGSRMLEPAGTEWVDAPLP